MVSVLLLGPDTAYHGMHTNPIANFWCNNPLCPMLAEAIPATPLRQLRCSAGSPRDKVLNPCLPCNPRKGWSRARPGSTRLSVNSERHPLALILYFTQTSWDRTCIPIALILSKAHALDKGKTTTLSCNRATVLPPAADRIVGIKKAPAPDGAGAFNRSD